MIKILVEHTTERYDIKMLSVLAQTRS